jgi:hypothetical protein
MKYLTFLLLAILSLTSCGDNENEIFEISYDANIFYEAGLSQFEVHFIDNFDIPTLINARLTASGRTREDINKILPKSAELVNIRNDIGLDFIRNLELDVFEGSVLAPNIKENQTEIFFRQDVPQDRSSFIDLIPSLPDVKDYLLEETFNFTIRTELRAPPPNTIEARLRLTFSVQ